MEDDPNYRIKDESEIPYAIDLINKYNKKNVKVKKSLIPGTDMWGLFATRDFKVGEKICGYGGFFVKGNMRTFDFERPDKLRQIQEYQNAYGGGIIIDGRVGFKLKDECGRFANGFPPGSPEINANFKKHETKKNVLVLVALRQISKNEEIIADYGRDYDWKYFIPGQEGPQIKYTNMVKLHNKTLNMEPHEAEKYIENNLQFVYYTLNSYMGTLDNLRVNLNYLDPFDLFGYDLDSYVIKSKKDYEDARQFLLQFRSILENEYDFNLGNNNVIIKQDGLFAKKSFESGKNITIIGGIYTEMNVYYPDESFQLSNGWFLCPYKGFRLFKDFGNLAKLQNYNYNCIINDKLQVVAYKDIENGDEIIIKFEAINGSDIFKILQSNEPNERKVELIENLEKLPSFKEIHEFRDEGTEGSFYTPLTNDGYGFKQFEDVSNMKYQIDFFNSVEDKTLIPKVYLVTSDKIYMEDLKLKNFVKSSIWYHVGGKNFLKNNEYNEWFKKHLYNAIYNVCNKNHLKIWSDLVNKGNVMFTLEKKFKIKFLEGGRTYTTKGFQETRDELIRKIKEPLQKDDKDYISKYNPRIQGEVEIDDLYNRAISMLPKPIPDVDKVRDVNIWVKLETKIDENLVNELKNYVVQPGDDRKKVVFLANLLSGPKVLVSKGKGYGLFSDKLYGTSLQNRLILEYGGKVVNNKISGDYVLTFEIGETEVTMDSENYFKLSEKGRWVNDCRTLQNKKCPSDLIIFGIGKMRNQKQLYENQEIVFDYGDEYQRPWLEQEEEEEEKKKKKRERPLNQKVELTFSPNLSFKQIIPSDSAYLLYGEEELENLKTVLETNNVNYRESVLFSVDAKNAELLRFKLDDIDKPIKFDGEVTVQDIYKIKKYTVGNFGVKVVLKNNILKGILIYDIQCMICKQIEGKLYYDSSNPEWIFCGVSCQQKYYYIGDDLLVAVQSQNVEKVKQLLKDKNTKINVKAIRKSLLSDGFYRRQLEMYHLFEDYFDEFDWQLEEKFNQNPN